MKVLFLSTTDIAGGAAVAAHRLFRTLRETGTDVSMEVQQQVSRGLGIRKPATSFGKFAAQARMPLEHFAVSRFYPQAKNSNFMAARLPTGLRQRIEAAAPDVLHVHWVGHGFMRPEDLAGLKMPIVWTLHDMWSLTGGCYYDGGCGRYEQQCGQCPMLGSTKENDLSRRTWKRKQAAWADLNVTLVSPSQWLARCARQSSLQQGRRVEVIPYGVNSQVFSPWPKAQARQMLGLKTDAKLILFGAIGFNDPRKGFRYLREALQIVGRDAQNVELAVFGGELDPAIVREIGLPCHSLGMLRDEIATALAYAAADVFVAPSLEDNLPNTVLESMACGTPVVGFRAGGIPDMVEHEVNGLLVEPRDVAQLAQALSRLTTDNALHSTLGAAARRKAQTAYAPELQAQRYSALYQKLLANRSS